MGDDQIVSENHDATVPPRQAHVHRCEVAHSALSYCFPPREDLPPPDIFQKSLQACGCCKSLKFLCKTPKSNVSRVQGRGKRARTHGYPGKKETGHTTSRLCCRASLPRVNIPLPIHPGRQRHAGGRRKEGKGLPAHEAAWRSADTRLLGTRIHTQQIPPHLPESTTCTTQTKKRLGSTASVRAEHPAGKGRMIYNLYIFNRKGKCLYYREWNRPQNTLENAADDGEEQRLMFGMLYSLKEVVTKMSTDPASAGLHALKTDSYTLHHLETGSGLRFVLNTDNNAGDLRPTLRQLYSGIFVEYVAKHPQFNPVDGSPIRLPAFDSRLEEYLRSLACFKS